MNTYKWLLKREYWEHKGGMFWAPVVVSSLMLLVALVSVFGAVATGKFGHMEVNGVPVTTLRQVVAPEDMSHIAEGVATAFFGTGMSLFAVMSFVIFFYLIGALYDDRSNRSVLFWKSLPISDRDTVVSKVVSALVMAPMITWVVASLASFALALIACIGMSLAGLNLFGAVLGNSKLYTLPFEFLACLPVYMLWSLPTVGWLLMVSAWARTKPFLWAVGLPLGTALLLVWGKALFNLPIQMGWFMQTVVSRLLLSAVPGSWSFQLRGQTSFAPDNLVHGSPLVAAWQTMATPQMWIGAAVGIAMIVVAIRLRRFRDEG